MERRGYRVEGEVQGVGFRFWTQHAAQQVGVTGTVANRTDGTVAVEAAGSAAQLDALEHALRQGPPYARVTAVHREPATTAPLPHRFEIVRG